VSPALLDVDMQPLPTRAARTQYQFDGNSHEKGSACALKQKHSSSIGPRLPELDHPRSLERAPPRPQSPMPCGVELHLLTDASDLENRIYSLSAR